MSQEDQYKRLAAEFGHQTFEKEAFLGLGAIYRGLRGLGTGLFRRTGEAITKAVTTHSPEAAKWLARLGRGSAEDMWTFGALGGGLGALTNPEDRTGGFLRGFATGALGGLGWRAGSNLARYGMRMGARALGPKAYRAFRGATSKRLFRPLTRAELKAVEAGEKVPGLWERRLFGEGRHMTYGQAAKLLGAKAAIGTVPFATGMAVSSMMPTFEGGEAPPPRPSPPIQPALAMTPYMRYPTQAALATTPYTPYPVYGRMGTY